MVYFMKYNRCSRESMASRNFRMTLVAGKPSTCGIMDCHESDLRNWGRIDGVPKNMFPEHRVPGEIS